MIGASTLSPRLCACDSVAELLGRQNLAHPARADFFQDAVVAECCLREEMLTARGKLQSSKQTDESAPPRAS